MDSPYPLMWMRALLFLQLHGVVGIATVSGDCTLNVQLQRFDFWPKTGRKLT
jgi:hypothetical protein